MRLLLICALACLAAGSQADSLDEAFQAWKVKFDKVYETDVEEQVRKQIWLETAKTVIQHNVEYDLGLHTFTQTTNEMADLTRDEYRARLGYKMTLGADLNLEETEEIAPGTPSTQNWDAAGYVTSVKNQGNCGSCWAFSTCGATESMCAIAQGKSTLINLSEQELVSCDLEGCYGCIGGTYQSGFTFFQTQGAASLGYYPYTSGNGKSGTCNYAFQMNIVRQVAKQTATTPGSESALQSAVGNIGPVSVAIDASQSSFSNYQSGIYYSSTCSSTSLDHAVLVVGYNQNSDGQYWIVKNSWGTSWGQQGYIWMAKDRNNNCGIATEPVYPTCNPKVTDHESFQRYRYDI